jgi:hypothetical protein
MLTVVETLQLLAQAIVRNFLSKKRASDGLEGARSADSSSVTRWPHLLALANSEEKELGASRVYPTCDDGRIGVRPNATSSTKSSSLETTT